MDRSASPLSPGTPTGRVGSAASPAPPALSRVIEVAVGQSIQATVSESMGGGRYLLGWRGSLFEAFSTLSLQPGRSYEFTVAATSPKIVLSTAQPLMAGGGVGGPAAAGLLGLASGELASVLQRVALSEAPGSNGAVPISEFQVPAESGSDAGALQQAVRRLMSGAPEAADLELLQRRLGHDQEARVLGLEHRSPEQKAAAIADLRQSLKAEALRILDTDANDQNRASELASARKLVQGLNGIEADNARRVDRGAPLWLPLPVPSGETSPLLDARMFLWQSEGDGDGGGSTKREQPFTIVLLLELSQLGSLRVDVEVRDVELAITFVAAETSTVHALLSGRTELREALEGQGLKVDTLRVLQAPEQQIPVADLVLPPTDDGQSLVDVHA